MVREQLSIEEKRAIVRAIQVDGRSISSVARDYGRDRKTIQGVLKKATTGYCSLERRSKMSEASKQLVKRVIKDNPLVTLEQIQRKLEREGGSEVSRYTLSRYMTRHGYTPVKRKKHKAHKRGKNRNLD